MASSSNDQAKPFSPTKLGVSKAKKKDRHAKVNGRDRRIRIPTSCAPCVFQLSQVLGHRTNGQTIEWLLKQAEPAVNKALGITTSVEEAEAVIPDSAPITDATAIAPPSPPLLPVSLMSYVPSRVEDFFDMAERQGSAPSGGSLYDLNRAGNDYSEFTIENFANMPLTLPIFF